MPGYFSLVFEMKKSRTAIRDFCTALIDAGPVFKSGYWGFENDTFDEIVRWNQDKLNSDFLLGYSQHHSHDYKQMLFDYADFSEVRLFIFNHRRCSAFIYELIVPEDDLIVYEKSGDEYITQHKTERMELLKNLAKAMWRTLELSAIQTAWECSDCPPLAKKISAKTKPQAEPFCIIKHSSVAEKLGLPYETTDRNGILIDVHDPM